MDKAEKVFEKLSQYPTRTQLIDHAESELNRRNRRRALDSAVASGIGSAGLTGAVNAVSTRKLMPILKSMGIAGAAGAGLVGGWSYLSGKNKINKWRQQVENNG